MNCCFPLELFHRILSLQRLQIHSHFYEPLCRTTVILLIYDDNIIINLIIGLFLYYQALLFKHGKREDLIPYGNVS